MPHAVLAQGVVVVQICGGAGTTLAGLLAWCARFGVDPAALHAHDTYGVPPEVVELKPATPPDVRQGMWTGGGLRGPGVGWDAATQINETTDPNGQVFPGVFNKGANQGEADANPWTQAMQSRTRDDPGVCALREHLRENNGIRGVRTQRPLGLTALAVD